MHHTCNSRYIGCFVNCLCLLACLTKTYQIPQAFYKVHVRRSIAFPNPNKTYSIFSVHQMKVARK